MAVISLGIHLLSMSGKMGVNDPASPLAFSAHFWLLVVVMFFKIYLNAMILNTTSSNAAFNYPFLFKWKMGRKNKI